MAIAASPAAAGADTGSWLLAGSAGAARFALLRCPDGSRLADAALSDRLAAPPVTAAGDTSAYAITEAGELLSFELPSMRRRGVRPLPMRAARLTASEPDGEWLAVGGSGSTPLAVIDANSLADAQLYRPDKATIVSAIGHAPGRSSFVVGLAEPAGTPEVWEIAYGADAPPVFKGLVHDYRMGEAIALPGRFTPRAAPVSVPTAALAAGTRASEWLRIGSDGAAGVLHLEVRREIARLSGTGAAPEHSLAVAWQAGHARGWFLGTRGARSLQVLQAGDDWRVSRRIDLPAPLLALQGFAGDRSAVLALGGEEITLALLDAATLTLQRRPGSPVAGTGALRLPVRLERSRDGRCVALIDAADRWVAATLGP